MSPSMDLESWIRTQYQVLGLNSKGQFIGRKAFKNRLFDCYRTSYGNGVPTLQIKQLVNSLDIASQVDRAIPANEADVDTNHSNRNQATSTQPSEAAEANGFNPSVHVPDGKFEIQASINPKLKELREFTESSLADNGDGHLPLPTIEDQRYLLEADSEDGVFGGGTLGEDDIANAALFSAEALKVCDPSSLPQHGLLGKTCPGFVSSWPVLEDDSRLFQNTNVPFSVFICGLQGSGKSHTLSCLLGIMLPRPNQPGYTAYTVVENCLINTPVLGNLHKKLSALVLHYSQYNSVSSFRPCEAAFLACPSRQFPSLPCVAPVNILVAPSNYHNLRAWYEQIPGVNVEPFRLRPRDLNVSSMLTLMAVDQSHAAPLYIGQITKILRDMASTSFNGFNYPDFKRRLQASKLSRAQQGPLQQRLDILESFLILDDAAPSWSFENGGATVIDLSCPFVDPNMACVLFKIGVSLYLESGLTTGKVIAIDEAHKYMTDTPASKVLTDSLLSIIRQQRHFGARVIISTQEPTISPRLMDLCSTTVVHRFTSPEWFSVLRQHISVVDESNDELFKRILDLRVGEALLFAPSTLLCRPEEMAPKRLGSDLLKLKVRKRVTWDGGKSVVCVR
ncbi:MAG: hypothetical protein Q9163_001173 [Psora crenata]